MSERPMNVAATAEFCGESDQPVNVRESMMLFGTIGMGKGVLAKRMAKPRLRSSLEASVALTGPPGSGKGPARGGGELR